MAIDVRDQQEPSVQTLVGGIIEDARHLVEQQLAMFRQELRADVHTGKVAAIRLAVGMGFALVGAILLSVMLSHLLHWAVPELPLWSCFGIVGGVLALLGAILIYAGVRRFESISRQPSQSIEALKENLQWTTNPK